MISSMNGSSSIVMNTALQPLLPDLQPAADFTMSRAAEPPAVLRARLAADGYLFLPGLLDSAPLLRARADILGLCRDAGWLDPAQPFIDGIAGTTRICEGDEAYKPVYRQVVRLPSFNACAVAPKLMSVLRALFDGEPFAHPRNIARIAFPGHQATQPHQDYHYIRGTTETYTCWIPTADVPNDLGGLAVLPGSHRRGFLPHQRTTGAGGMGVDANGLGTWTSGEFRLGDVLLFHSHTIHGARPHRDPRRIRLSFDFRYQRPADAIDPSSLCYHMEDQHRPA